MTDLSDKGKSELFKTLKKSPMTGKINFSNQNVIIVVKKYLSCNNIESLTMRNETFS